ncbi:hypothetical protein KUTeg_021744 [Tegillarca granosa]|uniref:Tyr recombinase domain-containing protein n=1 Tax=Tegillarca granosa TaxID=220873 RepID=A0ABQ9E9T4_TEGGR|nr:hypothetical protein KUTeg_021744 [Tegillarca granosa]
MGYQMVPASSSNIQVYVAYLASCKKLKYSTIRQYLNILTHIHKLSGYPDPLQDDYQLHHELMGVKRELGTAQKPVDIITPDLLIAIRRTLNLRSIADSSFWCACQVSFFGLLRPGNIVVNRIFNKDRDLRRLDAFACNWGFIIRLRWTKTIQFREKVFEVLLPRIQHELLCPAKAIELMLSLTVGFDPLGPLFLADVGSVLTYELFRTKLRTALIAAGHDPSNIKGHSFRRGGATWLHKIGIPLDFIKAIGGWASDCVLRYIDHNFDQRLQVMLRFGDSMLV